MLTVDAVEKHDRSQRENDAESMVTDSDQQTMGTFKTWATNWTECTNTTFSKVHRYWSSNSALHKEVMYSCSLLYSFSPFAPFPLPCFKSQMFLAPLFFLRNFQK